MGERVRKKLLQAIIMNFGFLMGWFIVIFWMAIAAYFFMSADALVEAFYDVRVLFF